MSTRRARLAGSTAVAAQTAVPPAVEYYADLASCGGRSHLFTRVGGPNAISSTLSGWRTVVRTIHQEGARKTWLGRPRALAVNEFSHNLAVECDDQGRLLLMGGQDRTVRTNGSAHAWRGLRHYGGIFRAVGTASADGLSVSVPQPVLTGSHPGCLERRRGFGRTCEYDGKLSLVRWRGRLLLYARSNTHASGSGRHVQFASSADSGLSWSPFRLISMRGAAPSRATNIYFLKAFAHNSTHLGAVFPAVLGARSVGRSGIYVSFSVNGAEWSRPAVIVPLLTHDDVHVPRHPVGVLGGRLVVLSLAVAFSRAWHVSQPLSQQLADGAAALVLRPIWQQDDAAAPQTIWGLPSWRRNDSSDPYVRWWNATWDTWARAERPLRPYEHAWPLT